jgi:hypothetical protein
VYEYVYDYVPMKSPYSYTYLVHSNLFLNPVRPGRIAITPSSRPVPFIFSPMLRGVAELRPPLKLIKPLNPVTPPGGASSASP